MNTKVWSGALAVFLTVGILDTLINALLLTAEYEASRSLWRAPGEINMSLLIICYAVQAFVFSFIFSKGYQGRGVPEGLRFGLYVAFLMVLPLAWTAYAAMPVSAMLALKWSIYGTVTWVVAGAVVALVFGKRRHPPVPAM